MRFTSISKRRLRGCAMLAKDEPPRAQSVRIGWHDWKEPERGIPSVLNLSRTGRRLLTKSGKSSPSPEAQPRSVSAPLLASWYADVFSRFTYTGSLRDDERVSVSSYGTEGRPCASISVFGVDEPAPQSAPLDSARMVSFCSRMFWRSTRGIVAGS